MQDGGNAVDAAMAYLNAAITEPTFVWTWRWRCVALHIMVKDGEVQKCMNIKHFPLDYKRRSIGTPGFVRGMHDMHEREGKWMKRKY